MGSEKKGIPLCMSLNILLLEIIFESHPLKYQKKHKKYMLAC